jgi:hypothetical protein
MPCRPGSGPLIIREHRAGSSYRPWEEVAEDAHGDTVRQNQSEPSTTPVTPSVRLRVLRQSGHCASARDTSASWMRGSTAVIGHTGEDFGDATIDPRIRIDCRRSLRVHPQSDRLAVVIEHEVAPS